MSARYWELEDSVDNWALEDGTGARLVEDATTTSVSNTYTYKYDIAAIVSKVFTYLYDITGTILKTFKYLYDINGAASSALTNQTGTVTPTALNSEICFITKTDGPYHYALWLDLDQMQSGDAIEVKVQRWDPTSQTWKNYKNAKTIKYSDINSDNTSFIPFLPAVQYRVCLKQTTGTLRSYNWELYKSP